MDDDRYLPEHVYPNWLLLAARVAADAPDRDAWRRWAAERLEPRISPPPAVHDAPTRAMKARPIGQMAEAEAVRRHW
jgi:hypothetical protein